MTVCVGIKVRDCLVFAADSAVSMVATSADGSPVVTNIWNHGTKVFNLHKALPIVAMTAGAGNVAGASLSDLAKYLRDDLTNGSLSIEHQYSIKDVANRAKQFFARVASTESFDFWLGGYGSDEAFSEVWKFSFVNGAANDLEKLVATEVDNNVFWGGSTAPISRLVLGLDPAVKPELLQANVPPEVVEQLELAVVTPLVDAAMPVQDAIDLADFLVDVTKRYSAFLPGANVVGGETDIATVTRHEGFKWIRRKHYYPEHLNRGNDLV